MKILFDQGTPVPLRYHLHNHEVHTAAEKGWSELKNGNLLETAESERFDLLLTTDQSIRYQQNLSSRKIALLVLKTTSWPRIQNQISLVLDALEDISTGDYVEIEFQ